MNNQPAFPSLHWVAPQGHSANENPQGMTLRDYFAAKAMVSMQERYYDMFLNNTFEDWNNEGIPALAMDSYEIADAMLKAREA